MDTNEQTPVGGQDVSSSQDTTADIAQPTQTDEVVDGNQSDEAAEASPLLAGKYSSPQELEKAYQELQGKLGEQGQKAEVANLIEKQTGMNAQQIKDYLTQQSYAQYQQQVQVNPGLAAFQEVQTLKNQMALQTEQNELDKFISSEEGKPYTEFKDKILNLGLNLERGKGYDEIARDYFGKAIAKGQQDAYKKIDKKVMTQATGASKGAPRSKITSEELDAMSHKDRIAAMEAMYPHADTSNRPY